MHFFFSEAVILYLTCVQPSRQAFSLWKGLMFNSLATVFSNLLSTLSIFLWAKWSTLLLCCGHQQFFCVLCFSVLVQCLFISITPSPLALIHQSFLAGKSGKYTATARSLYQAIFKDYSVLEWGPSLARTSTEGPLCLLPNSPVSPWSRRRLGDGESQWAKW